MTNEDVVLNVEEAAQLLRVSPWTVRELARRGRLPGRRVGKEWRFWRRALLEWLRGEKDRPGIDSDGSGDAAQPY